MRSELTFRKRSLSVKTAHRRQLLSLAALFLRLGATAFGGPAVHIGMMQREVVTRLGWLTHEEFLDLLGASNLIPGPNSTELALHVGHRRAGWAGLLVAGVCFILPAALIVGALAWIYVRFGRLPRVSAVLYGVKPVMIAVVLQALGKLARTAVRSVSLGVLGVLAVGAVALGTNELLVLLGAGVVAALQAGFPRRKALGAGAGFLAGLRWASPTALASGVVATAATTAAASFSVAKLFAICLKMGATLFGSGYVLLAYLRADLVQRLGWLGEGQLLDAVTVGQITPGPLFTTATFVGYLIGGAAGAVAATVGIFLPAFVFVAASGPLVPRLRRSRLAGAFLDGVNVASLALMAVVTAQLGRAALVDGWTVAIALGSAGLLWRFDAASIWLLVGGAAAGLVGRWQ